jgi:hypothetical protein
VHVEGGEYWFRIHQASLTAKYAGRKWWQRGDFEGWSAQSLAGRIVFPSWRRLGSYLRSIRRAPLPLATRLRLHGTLARTYLLDDRAYLAKLLLKDLVVAGRLAVRRLQRPASASKR